MCSIIIQQLFQKEKPFSQGNSLAEKKRILYDEKGLYLSKI